MSIELIEQIRGYLATNDYTSFRLWCRENEQLIAAETSRGMFLRLKDGNKLEARAVLQKLSPCVECSYLPWGYPDGVHSSAPDSRSDFFRALESLESASAQGVLRKEGSGFLCLTCGAKRNVDLPEREFSGQITTVS